MRRRESVIAIALLAAALLTGCASAPTEPPSSPSSTPTPTVDPEAIRDVDFGSLEWTWDSLGTQYPVQLVDGEAEVQDAYYQQPARFQVGEPTYSDANGDGLTDAAVPLQWESGNGVMKNWFIWLAQSAAPDAPQQVPFPIASAARCADAVEVVEATDGGFRVDEVMRSSLEAAGACAETATMERSREVAAAGDGTGAGSWPVTLDGQGWGGYCPVKVYTEGAWAEAQGRVGPSDAAPETSATGEKLFTPIQHYPFLQPEGWRLTGFLPEDQTDDSVVCVWMPQG